MTDDPSARTMLTDVCGVRYFGGEAFIPKAVVDTWEWVQDKPWPQDGKPYSGWALVKAAKQEDFATVLDSIHRMVGMVGAMAYVEKGVDLR